MTSCSRVFLSSAISTAGHLALDNFTVIYDQNKITCVAACCPQVDGSLAYFRVAQCGRTHRHGLH